MTYKEITDSIITAKDLINTAYESAMVNDDKELCIHLWQTVQILEETLLLTCYYD